MLRCSGATTVRGATRWLPLAWTTGSSRTVERYHCSYGLSPDHLGLLAAHGMLFSGHDPDGEVRVAELPGHPFFLCTLFQPELAAGDPHPVIRGFVRAVAGQPG